MSQRVGRGIAVQFHDRGTGRWWVVSSTPRPHFTPGKDPVPVLQEAGWAPGPIWTGRKSRPHRDKIPNRPARSQSLYWLSYRAHKLWDTTLKYSTTRPFKVLPKSSLPVTPSFDDVWYTLLIIIINYIETDSQNKGTEFALHLNRPIPAAPLFTSCKDARSNSQYSVVAHAVICRLFTLKGLVQSWVGPRGICGWHSASASAYPVVYHYISTRYPYFIHLPST